MHYIYIYDIKIEIISVCYTFYCMIKCFNTLIMIGGFIQYQPLKCAACPNFTSPGYALCAHCHQQSLYFKKCTTCHINVANRGKNLCGSCFLDLTCQKHIPTFQLPQQEYVHTIPQHQNVYPMPSKVSPMQNRGFHMSDGRPVNRNFYLYGYKGVDGPVFF